MFGIYNVAFSYLMQSIDQECLNIDVSMMVKLKNIYGFYIQRTICLEGISFIFLCDYKKGSVLHNSLPS